MDEHVPVACHDHQELRVRLPLAFGPEYIAQARDLAKCREAFDIVLCPLNECFQRRTILHRVRGGPILHVARRIRQQNKRCE